MRRLKIFQKWAYYIHRAVQNSAMISFRILWQNFGYHAFWAALFCFVRMSLSPGPEWRGAYFIHYVASQIVHLAVWFAVVIGDGNIAVTIRIIWFRINLRLTALIARDWICLGLRSPDMIPRNKPRLPRPNNQQMGDNPEMLHVAQANRTCRVSRAGGISVAASVKTEPPV